MAAAAADEPPFIGRIEAVDALRRRSVRAREGRGGLTLVEGEAGVGKSLLVRRLVEEARAAGLRVLLVRAAALENPPPLHLVRAALQEAEAAEAEGGGPPAPDLPTLALGSPSAETSMILGFAPGRERAAWRPRASEAELLEAVTGAGESADAGRGRLLAQGAERLLGVAGSGPALLAVEDLHLADEDSLEAIGFLAAQLGEHALWLLATTLPIASLPDPKRGLLERIARAPTAETVTLRPFTPGETLDFVRVVAPGPGTGVEEATRWHSESGGNPLFLAQLLRARGEGPRSGAAAEPVAPELTEYLLRRLPELGEAEHRVMTVASILGRRFPFALLLKASEEEEERLTEIVERIAEVGILRENPGEEIEFVRDDLRSQIYQGLTDAHRRLLHKRAGEALEAFGVADASTVFAIARHYYLGRVDDKSAMYNRAAAEIAARAFAPAVGRQHLEHALESLKRTGTADPAAEVEMTLDLAVQLDRLGELKDAERLLRSLLARPATLERAEPTQRAFLPIYLARVLTDEGRWTEAEKMTRSIAEAPPVAGSVAGQIALHRLRGEILYYLGEYEASLAQHDEAMRLARELNHPREIALERARRANVLGMIPGRLDEAVADYRRSVDELDRIGDDAEVAFTLIFLAVVLSQHGRTDEGLPILEEAVRRAERAHDPRRVGWALFNSADLKLDKGLVDAAAEDNRRSREVLERVGDRFGLVQTHIVQGKLELRRARLPEAELELLDAYRLVRELRAPADEVEVILRLAEVALARGDPAMALKRVKELEARGAARLRPDLVADFDALKGRLAAHGTGDAAPG